jgi:predicted MFS family arabinose efflux permease
VFFEQMNKTTNSHTPRFVALFTFIRLILHTAQRMVYPFLPIFASGMNVSVNTISFALGFATFASILSPFLAPIADRSGRRAGMLLGSLIFSVGMGVVAIAPGEITFIISMLLSTMGINLAIPSIHSYLSDITAYSKRGFVLAITETAWALAYVIGMPLIGILIEKTNWQTPFAVMAGFGVLLMVLLLVLVPSDSHQPKFTEKRGFNLKLVFTSPVAWAALVLGLGMVSANQVVNVFYSTWLVEKFALQAVALGAVSIVIGFSELGGEAMCALIVDRLGKERSILFGFIGNSVVALLFPLLEGSILFSLVWLFLFFLTFEFTIVACLPLMTEVLPRARTTLLAAFLAALSLGRSLGAFIAPFLYNWGFFALCLAAVVFNILAMLMLRRVKISPQGNTGIVDVEIP